MWATTDKAIGTGMPKPYGIRISPPRAPDIIQGAKELSIFPAGFWFCFDLIPTFYVPILPYGNSNVYPIPVPPLYFGSI